MEDRCECFPIQTIKGIIWFGTGNLKSYLCAGFCVYASAAINFAEDLIFSLVEIRLITIKRGGSSFLNWCTARYVKFTELLRRVYVLFPKCVLHFHYKFFWAGVSPIGRRSGFTWLFVFKDISLNLPNLHLFGRFWVLKHQKTDWLYWALSHNVQLGKPPSRLAVSHWCFLSCFWM